MFHDVEYASILGSTLQIRSPHGKVPIQPTYSQHCQCDRAAAIPRSHDMHWIVNARTGPAERFALLIRRVLLIDYGDGLVTALHSRP